MMQVETKHNRIIAGAGEYLAACMKNGNHKKQAVTEFFLRIGLKNCNRCGNVKILSDFRKDKKSWNGLHSLCKDCHSAAVKENHIKNKEHNSNRMKLYREKNKDKILNTTKLYYVKNKEKIYEYQKKWFKLKMKSDDNQIFKLKRNIKTSIVRSITSKGYTKKSRTPEILGCDFEFFRQHIERQFLPGMTWEKLGSEIHIDHIIPLASATTEEEVIALNHFTNLRPCWAVENLRKSDNIEFLI